MELDMLNQKVDLLFKENQVNLKANALEFERISKAFNQLGNLVDLLYLQVSVLIEMLHKKEVINQEEFAKTLEETAKKVEEQIMREMKKAETPEEPEAEKL